jgi:hypothetical protein
MNRWVYNISMLLGVACVAAGFGTLLGIGVGVAFGVAAGFGAGIGGVLLAGGLQLILLSIFTARVAASVPGEPAKG